MPLAGNEIAQLPAATVAVQESPSPSPIVILPVGVPLLPVTVNVIVTACPTTDGFGVCVVIVVAVLAWFTVCDNAEEVLLVKFVSPLYVAVIECEPMVSVEIESVAVFPASAPVPMIVAPSLNVTVPVAVPDPGATAATVAVNVTDWPEVEGFVPLTSVVVVLDWFTVCETVFEALAAKIVVPAYDAVRL